MSLQIPANYVARVYAGWLGKIIGVRHGSNIEGWTAEKIAAVYGEIQEYLFTFKHFAADDDTNGPIFFIRALDDCDPKMEITPESVGDAWLNYVPYEHGFFWWGGYGRSTEHTAYLNLRQGIPAPRSGSIAQNGAAVAEQIGGQIFIDTWGLVMPGDYQKAARFAELAASVSHDGNGVYGGMFIAACISAAFIHTTIHEVVRCGLSTIPHACELYRMSQDILAFHRNNPEHWRDCFAHIQQQYGYDRYPGNCHIIPNAAVILLSLLYGAGDFSRSINLCNQCGWDTDCNVANVGTILGVLNGLAGIPMHWRIPINDLLICSSVLGSLNIMDIPANARYLAGLGYRLAGQEPVGQDQGWIGQGRGHHDFDLPGATHSFFVETSHSDGADVTWSQSAGQGQGGTGALKASAKLFDPVDQMRVVLKTYYRPEDFSDSRYFPAFSPILYPGQQIQTVIRLDPLTECDMQANLFAWDGNQNQWFRSAPIRLLPGKWTRLVYTIPSAPGACLEKTGIELTRCSGGMGIRTTVQCFVDSFHLSGTAQYEIDFHKERMERWSPIHREVSQLTWLKGIWELEQGELSGSCADFGEAYTGDIDWTDYTVEAILTPQLGPLHRLNFRVQGAIRSYAVGLADNQRLVLYKNNKGYQPVAETDCAWESGHSYRLKVVAHGSAVQVFLNDSLQLSWIDPSKPYLHGQIGFSVDHGSHCHFSSVKIGP